LQFQPFSGLGTEPKPLIGLQPTLRIRAHPALPLMLDPGGVKMRHAAGSSAGTNKKRREGGAKVEGNRIDAAVRGAGSPRRADHVRYDAANFRSLIAS
jgi:hypothetical protein